MLTVANKAADEPRARLLLQGLQRDAHLQPYVRQPATVCAAACNHSYGLT